jgi:hypothetical protein
MYIINANQFFIVETDQFDGNDAIISGRAVVTASSYTSASISGNEIVHLAGSTSGSAGVTLGLLSFTSGVGTTGTVAGTVQSFSNGGSNANTITTGLFAIDASSGRVTLGNAGSNPPILYAATPTDGISSFVVGTDIDAAFGFAEFQPGATYSASSLSGSFLFGTEDPADNTVPNIVGAMVIPTNATGTGNFVQDTSDGGLNLNQAFSETLSVNSDGTGTGQLVGGNSPNIFLVTNGTKLFYVVLGGSSVIKVAEQ